jgi:hypothetical protein
VNKGQQRDVSVERKRAVVSWTAIIIGMPFGGLCLNLGLTLALVSKDGRNWKAYTFSPAGRICRRSRARSVY